MKEVAAQRSSGVSFALRDDVASDFTLELMRRIDASVLDAVGALSLREAMEKLLAADSLAGVAGSPSAKAIPG